MQERQEQAVANEPSTGISALTRADNRPYLSVVVPIYNEEESIPALYERLVAVLDTAGYAYELIMVDDGSSDSSFALLQQLAQQDERLRVVRFRRNFGQTAAFSAGFDRARGEVIVTIDADLQNDPADIPRVIERLNEGYDVVSGWRANRQDVFWKRRLPSHMANRLISWSTGVALHDYGCSLKAYRTDVLHNIRLYGELHRFIPAIASWQGVSVAELPVEHHARQFGRSKYGINRTLRVMLDLLTVRFLLSYATRPMQVFGPVGLASSAVGAVLGFYLSYVRLILGRSVGRRPLLLLSVLLILLGAQFLGMGILGELVMRVYYEGQQKPIYVVREELNAKDASNA
ncbi:MAG: glycosyltransferase family 2 protein [Chloroflexaceae bacterium]|nr:glycosyltransferase family 2 protein [Chloroflexaceae bacterium]